MIEGGAPSARIVESILSDAGENGFHLEWVDSFSKAMDRLNEENIDLILLDLSLPDSNGLNTLLKVQDKAPGLPVVVLIGSGDEEIAIQAAYKGAKDYLVKGQMDADSLVETIRHVIKDSKAESEIQKQRKHLEKRVEEYIAELERTNEYLYGEIEGHREAKEALKETTRQLKDQHDFYLNCIKSLPHRFYVIDAMSHVVLFANTTVNPNNHHGHTYCYSLMYGRNKPCKEVGYPCPLEKVKRTGGAAMDEHIHLDQDGQTRTFEIHASPVFDNDGNIIQVLKHDLDIGKRNFADKERERLEKQLIQAQKMKTIGTLAGGIAHDFNNILSPIIGYTEMCMLEVPEGGSVWRNLEQVLRAANRARDLTKQILSFSRRSENERKPLKVQLILKEALQLIKGSLPSNIEIHQEIDEACGAVLADVSQIYQVLINLCTNAYHAMRRKGGVLEVILTEQSIDSDEFAANLDLCPGSYVKLCVNDTGHGMESKVMKRIFEPYFTTKDIGEGTGMGLSVVHGIVQNHGGHVSVSSKPNKGTSFTVYLPRIEMDRIDSQCLPKEPLLRGNERILLVDDEVQLVHMMQQMLEHLGYYVTARTSSVEALEAFRTHPERFDVVITDQTMPNMMGTELAQTILSIRPDIPIILCTGFSEAIAEEKMKDKGIRKCAMKPIAMNDISKMIRQVLNQKSKV
ncbi:MAG: response regulator [Desulfatiglans sp.]|nr:response regulator [Desulfatiglans sp.]